MKKLVGAWRAFQKDESGASLVEYSLLIGLITAGVVVLVGAVGGWVSGEWTNLATDLGVAP